MEVFLVNPSTAPLAIRIAIITNGDITSTHENVVYPFLQMKLRVHVHAAINAILIRTYKKGKCATTRIMSEITDITK